MFSQQLSLTTQSIFSLGLVSALALSSFGMIPTLAVSAVPLSCTTSQVLVAGTCTDSAVTLTGAVYEDFNDNGRLDDTDRQHPVSGVKIFANQTVYCPPSSCGYTYSQNVYTTDSAGKFSLKSNYGIETKVNLFDSNRVGLNDSNKTIQVLPATQSPIRSTADNTFGSFLVRKTNTKRLPTVGDIVFYDKNGNGIQDVGEQGIAYIAVSLFDQYNREIGDIQYTDANGNYSFTTEPRDGLYLKFATPESSSLVPTTRNVGFDDRIDSDINSSGISDRFNLRYEERKTGMDAGFYIAEPDKVVASGSIFNDINGNGRFDSKKDYFASSNKVTLSDTSGSVITTTYSDSAGLYRFANLISGMQYTVTVTPITGYRVTTGKSSFTQIFRTESPTNNRLPDVGVQKIQG